MTFQMKRFSLLAIPLALSALFFASCQAPIDHAALVGDACNYIPEYASETTSSLDSHPECRAKILQALGDRLDTESFKSAPAGHVDRVLEAFQALLGYPLASPPENSFLGVMPTDADRGISAGAFFPKLLDVYNGNGATLNQSAFNYVIDSIDKIVYREQTSGANANAKFKICFSLDPRVMIITQHFSQKKERDKFSFYPFLSAAVLLHEAAHSDLARLHSLCTEGDYKGMINCDQGLGGAYGVALAYLQRLMHGSAAAVKAGTWTGLDSLERTMISWDACSMFHEHILDKSPEYQAISSQIPNGDCSQALSSWMETLEGLKF